MLLDCGIFPFSNAVFWYVLDIGIFLLTHLKVTFVHIMKILFEVKAVKEIIIKYYFLKANNDLELPSNGPT